MADTGPIMTARFVYVLARSMVWFSVVTFAVSLHPQEVKTEDERTNVTMSRGGSVSCEPLFPRSDEPSKELLVVTPLPTTWSDRLLLASLQGLVNRRQPFLYLGEDTPLDLLRARGYSTRTIGWEEAIRRFASEAQGAVLYDPKKSATVAVALTQAAIESAVPATLEQALCYNLKPVASHGTELDTEEACFTWAAEHLWLNCSRKTLCFLRLGSYEREGQIGPDSLHAELMADYLVRNKIFTMFLPADKTSPVLKIAEQLLMDMEPLRPVMGMFEIQNTLKEWESVKLVSETGHFFVPSYVPNLTVHSGVPVADNELRAPQSRTVELDRSKVYLTFNVSDGDNMGYIIGGGQGSLMRQSLISERWWNDPRRGECPIGWSIGPLVSELAPDRVEDSFSHVLRDRSVLPMRVIATHESCKTLTIDAARRRKFSQFEKRRKEIDER